MNGREKCFITINFNDCRMAQWSEVASFFAGGSWVQVQIPSWLLPFFLLSSYFYPLAFYCLFSLLTLLASRDFCENVFLVLCFSRDHVPYHIVSLNREYLLHVHWPRCVWVIFSDIVTYRIYRNDNNVFWGKLGIFSFFGGGGGGQASTPQVP